MSRTTQFNTQILKNATANGVGTPILVADFRTIVLMITVNTAGTAGTLKVQGTGNANLPAFGSGSTQANFWKYLQVKNYDDGSSINGSTGIPITATGQFFVEINTNGVSWINVELSGVTGTPDVSVLASAFGETR